MEKCYDSILTMPSNYVFMNENEMVYVEGGIAPAAVIGIIVGCMAIGGGVYTIGQTAGQRVYYSGYSNSQYQKEKWVIRARVIATLGIVVGTIVMTGFENKYYEMVTGR